MPELILTILKLCLLALLYLFFLRVLRAVWVEVRSEGADIAPRPAGGGAASTRRGSAKDQSGVAAEAPASTTQAGRRRGPARGRQARESAPAHAGAAVASPGSGGPAGGPGRGAPQDIVVTNETGRRSAPIVIGSLVTVGRAESCEIRITDSFASQMHARVFDNDGVVYLEDLNSTNGTFLNEAKVRGTAPLHSGDVIQIGNTTLELQ